MRSWLKCSRPIVKWTKICNKCKKHWKNYVRSQLSEKTRQIWHYWRLISEILKSILLFRVIFSCFHERNKYKIRISANCTLWFSEAKIDLAEFSMTPSLFRHVVYVLLTKILSRIKNLGQPWPLSVLFTWLLVAGQDF